MSDITIIENVSEIAAGTRGSSLAVEAIKIASIKENKDLFSKYSKVVLENQNHLIYEDIKAANAKHIDGVIKVYNEILDKVVPVLKSSSFPLLISGDHANAGGSIAALKCAYPDKRIGVIWIDAHADLHSPYTSPSGNIHGMPVASALGEDNFEEKINKIKNDRITNRDRYVVCCINWCCCYFNKR